MTPAEQQQQIQHALDFSIARLTARMQPLEQASHRFAIARLAVVIIGVLGALSAAIVLNPLVAWLLVGLAFCAYLALAFYHRRLDNWIETLSLRRAQQTDLRARLLLDWDTLPPPRPIELQDKALARDLDLTGYRSLHQLLDTTISRRGTQHLAEWLTQTRPDTDALHARQNIVRELKTRARFRARFRLTYQRVLQRELEGDNLLEWLRAETDTSAARAKSLQWTLPVATLLVALNAALFIAWQFFAFPPFFLASLAAYIAFYYWNQKLLDSVLGAVVRVNAELDKFRALVQYLERASYHDAPHLAKLCAPFLNQTPLPSSELRRVNWITAGVGLRNNPFLAILLNVILPWDFLFAFLADRERARVAQALPEWVRVVHELDALIALANFAALNPGAVFPEIRADCASLFRARQMGHPLLAANARVCNDFEIAETGQVEILTGSNMAGKSTFLKTIGINFCLAYAGAPVIASEFCAQPLRLHTCIRITDSIADGFSYFYAEVKCLSALLREIETADEFGLLYLIDEIFRGTNNRERLIGSRAYIQSLLGARGAGLIATHDLELAHIADTNPRARNFHFRDEVRDGRLVFDYVLRAGPCPTTNALKIMQLEGLPIT